MTTTTNPATTYVTVAIPYVNAEPHVGHCYEYVAADIYARARRLAGDDVRFLGGTDDYSLKNVLAAEAAGVPTREYVDDNALRFVALNEPLHLSFDDYLRTSADSRHRPAVERLWRACAANGDLYQRTYEGDYCVGCEQFYDAGELETDGTGGRRCPEHLAPVERVAETNWFFRLSRYQRHIEQLIESRQLDIHPEPFRAEVLSFVRAGLRDISVSRSVERASGWGIPVPDDKTQVVYVWFDALTNYLSALDFGDPDSVAYRRWWLDADRRVHVVGKGIVRFHAVYWPAFLASAGQPVPTRIDVHPYLSVDGAKISKTTITSGSSTAPLELVAGYGADALRWWFARDVSATSDTDFTERRLVARANEDLANGAGNVTNRIVSLLRRHARNDGAGGNCGPADVDPTLEQSVIEAISDFDLHRAAGLVRAAVDALNGDLEAAKPWAVAKTDDHDQLDALLTRYAAAARAIARSLRPLVPSLAARLEAQLASGQAGEPRPHAFERLESV